MPELLSKFAGDFPDEASDAMHRLAANQFSRSVRAGLNKQPNKEIKKFLESELGGFLLSEPVFKFALASALEVLPGATLEETRRLIAYNLRVQAYEAFADNVLKLSGITALLEGELSTALEKARNTLGKISPPK